MTVTAVAAGQRIADALQRVPDLRVSVGLGRPISPPVAVVAPPELRWESLAGDGPTGGTWSVYLVVALSEFATGQLLELIGPVTAAINTYSGGVVSLVTPVVYPASAQQDLPAYQIMIEMVL